jgi:ferredoxin
MPYKITEECINCSACISECPNEAIYEAGANWEMNGQVYGEGDATPSGAYGFYSDEFTYIVPDKCTECVGYYDEPQCVSVCPNESVIKI